ncbi:Putative polypeptide deformylase (fragment) [Rhodococcus ruber]|uniref:Putative polypeptide deformylase n=1 Tax=Rhodococcus ruber TaxID=1830 RepID=A0A098BG56_9NOCA
MPTGTGCSVVTGASVLVVVAERVLDRSRHPTQAGHAPSGPLDGLLRGPGVATDELVDVQVAVEVADLVLQHPGEEAVALDLDRVALGVGAGDLRPLGAPGGELLAGDRQASLDVVVGVGHGLGDLRRLEHRVDHLAAAADHGAGLVQVGAVVDEQPQVDSDLVGGQADAVRRVHRLVHVGDQLGQFGRRLGDRFRRVMQDGVTDDPDRKYCHGARG